MTTFPPHDPSPREHPLVIHQSDLTAWQRCPAEFAYSAMGVRDDQNSASAWGTVVHHALHVLERYRDLDRAIETFLYYWHPHNIDQLTEPIPKDGWLPRQGYNDLRQRGVEILRRYAEWVRDDDHELLALEYDFLVPLRGTAYWLAGTVDRLAVRWHRKAEVLCIDDWKSGRQKWGLRHNVQGTLYAYASLQPEFWNGAQATVRRPFRPEAVQYRSKGFTEQQALDPARYPQRGEELARRFGLMDDERIAPRRFTWINLKEMRWRDGGYREELDYRRLRLAVEQVAASIEAGIYPLTLNGETCEYCVFRNTCGGLGVADVNHGAPERAFQ